MRSMAAVTTGKKAYEPPTLEKKQKFTEIAEGFVVTVTGAQPS